MTPLKLHVHVKKKCVIVCIHVFLFCEKTYTSESLYLIKFNLSEVFFLFFDKDIKNEI